MASFAQGVGAKVTLGADVDGFMVGAGESVGRCVLGAGVGHVPHVSWHAWSDVRPSPSTYLELQSADGVFATQLAQPPPVALPLLYRRHSSSSTHGVGAPVTDGATVGLREKVGPGVGAGVGHDPQATGHASMDFILSLLATDDIQNFEGFVATQSHVRVE